MIAYLNQKSMSNRVASSHYPLLHASIVFFSLSSNVDSLVPCTSDLIAFLATLFALSGPRIGGLCRRLLFVDDIL